MFPPLKIPLRTILDIKGKCAQYVGIRLFIEPKFELQDRKKYAARHLGRSQFY